MDTKIFLYDETDKKIGETYVRRARQLVQQQRAEWTDETHTAVRFLSVLDEWDELPEPDPPKEAKKLTENEKTRASHELKPFFWHSVCLVPVYFVILFFGLIVDAMLRY
ncbi:MAG: hypothetical protein FWE82_05890, partial [Defluviitaleaceae bacterium]|nr:hypothetical protein [Defluviitaleaceae bacterium]